MPKKVTLKDIAAKAGLSPASVSMILNRRSIDRFNAETVEQVYTIATELGYKSSKKKAYALVRPSDTLIIIICPSLFNPFYTTIIQGIEIAASFLRHFLSFAYRELLRACKIGIKFL